MPKQTGVTKSHKSGQAHSPGQSRAQKQEREERTSRKAGGRQKRNRDVKPTGGNDNPFNSIGKLTGGTKSKSGCLPKLFMILLPFTAAGAYFLIG